MKKMTLNEFKSYIKEQVDKVFELYGKEYDDRDMENNMENNVEITGEDDWKDWEQQYFDREQKRLKHRASMPMDVIVKHFQHYKIDASKFNPEILRKVYTNWFQANYEGLSDVEESEDGSGSVSVELDGMYGKHWISFDNQEEFNKYYENTILKDARDEFYEMYKQFELEDKAARGIKQSQSSNKNTLGNINPDVFSKLRGK